MTQKIMYLIVALGCLWAVGCGDDGGGSDSEDAEDTKELCRDGEDNDGDGDRDCDDSDCRDFCVEVDTEPDWRTTWVSSQQLTESKNEPPEEPGLASNTLRQIIRISVGGEQVRFTFSNEYGEAPLTLASVNVAEQTEKSVIDTDTLVALTFDGEPTVTIPEGETATSDAVEWHLEAQTDLAVTMLFDDAPPEDITGHPGSRTMSYLAEGDVMEEESLAGAKVAVHWYFISRVDVLTSPDVKAVVAFGDSITDGFGTVTNENNRWTDHFLRRLQDSEETDHIAVLNHGIGGNCMTSICLGPSGTSRFERDALGPLGVEWVILLNGINDLNRPKFKAERMIDAYESAAEAARDAGVFIIGGTIMPCEGHDYFDEDLEAARQEINDWIRTTDRLDAYIDFDEMFRDPDDETAMLGEYTNDGLHPNASGYEYMAESIDLGLFASDE